jgi:hypothetical protein
MRIMFGGLCAAAAAAALSTQLITAAPGTCEDLARLVLPHATVTRAQTVPAGQFTGTPAGILAPGAPSFRPYNTLPAFCRIAATLIPSSDSDIKMELGCRPQRDGTAGFWPRATADGLAQSPSRRSSPPSFAVMRSPPPTRDTPSATAVSRWSSSRRRPAANRGFTRDERRDRPHTSAVSLSPDRCLCRFGQHGRGEELRVQVSVTPARAGLAD